VRFAHGLVGLILAMTGCGVAWSNDLSSVDDDSAALAEQLGMPSPTDPRSYICSDGDAVVLLRDVQRAGADLTQAKSVTFYFYGPELALPGLQGDLEAIGFMVRPDIAPRARIATIDAMIDVAWVRNTIARLCEIGARHGVTITSWAVALPERSDH
jgi:hypothetical protein